MNPLAIHHHHPVRRRETERRRNLRILGLAARVALAVAGVAMIRHLTKP